MNIKVNNIKSLVICYTALCGELNINSFVSSDVVKKTRYLSNEITDLCNNRQLRKIKYDKSKEKFLRVSYPNGDRAILDISEELFHNFELLIGKQGQRYKGDKSYRERMKRQGELIQLFLQDSVPVNWINFSYEPGKAKSPENENGYINFSRQKSIFNSNGELLNASEILASLSRSKRYYFTSKSLSNTAYDVQSHNYSRYYGIYHDNDVLYIIYYFKSSNEVWSRDRERQILIQYKRINADIKGSSNTKAPAAIMYTSDIATADGILNPPKARKGQIRPYDVYEESFIVPLSLLEEESTLLKKCITDKDYKRHLLIEILGDNFCYDENKLSIGSVNLDGTMYDVYDIIDNNFSKAKLLSNEMGKGSILLIHKWQESIMRKFFEKNEVNFIVIDT